jgi:hypothetical protein
MIHPPRARPFKLSADAWLDLARVKPEAWWQSCSDARVFFAVLGPLAKHNEALYRSLVRAACACARLPTGARGEVTPAYSGLLDAIEAWSRVTTSDDDVRKAAEHLRHRAPELAEMFLAGLHDPEKLVGVVELCAARAASQVLGGEDGDEAARVELARCADLVRANVPYEHFRGALAAQASPR